jgi:DNA-binding GntR family transcriptional regulator
MEIDSKPNSVREKAYYYVKDLILSNQLESGQKLNQERIAKQLDISRTPIREALHRLRSEGLVTISQTGGFRVYRLSLEELEELFDIRSMLEGYLIRTACKNIPEDELKRLAKYISESEKAIEDRNSDDIYKWNTKFHDTFQQYSKDKQRTNNIIANMKEHMLKYRKHTLYYLDIAKRTIAGHKKILIALQTRDPDLCEYMMRKHIMDAKDNAISITFGNPKSHRVMEKALE